MIDKLGGQIKVNQLLLSKYGFKYKTIFDEDLGICTQDIITGTIDKLYPETAQKFTILRNILDDEKSRIL